MDHILEIRVYSHYACKIHLLLQGSMVHQKSTFALRAEEAGTTAKEETLFGEHQQILSQLKKGSQLRRLRRCGQRGGKRPNEAKTWENFKRKG